MLLNDRSLRVVFDPLDQGKGLFLFHVIDHLQLLRRVHTSDLFKCIGQRVEIRGAGMIGRGYPCLDRGLGSFLIPLDRVRLILRLAT